MANEYTPTELRMLKVLSDGAMHTRAEFVAVLDDEFNLAASRTVSVWMCNLRRKLEKKRETVVCQFYNGTYYYRHVRLLASQHT